MSNPHFRISAERLFQAPKSQGSLETQIHFMGDAITQATLALAYEQRTANLIAAHALNVTGFKGAARFSKAIRADLRETADLLEKRLGLGRVK